MTEEPALRLRSALEARGLPWPAPIEHYPIVGSTNDRLKERARSGAPEWTVVVADKQTAGRGRRGRRWASPPGNLYLSVLLRPSSPAASVLPLAAGVAIAEALAPLGVVAALKWPNDVLVGARKLAGVLAEASSSASGLEWMVMGIGVNLDPRGMPDELRATATSLEAEIGHPGSREELAAAVLARLTVWYHALIGTGPASLLDAWRSRSVGWWGKPVEARSGDQVMRGVARDVDERGALLLDLEDGSRRAILSGEVQEVRLLPAEARTCS